MLDVAFGIAGQQFTRLDTTDAVEIAEEIRTFARETTAKNRRGWKNPCVD